jgi:hypothetical protein
MVKSGHEFTELGEKWMDYPKNTEESKKFIKNECKCLKIILCFKENHI